MNKKKIVMFFGKKRKEPDPFCTFEKKRSVYYDFFKEGKKNGFEVFLANGKECYKNKLIFDNLLYYSKKAKGFIKTDKELSVDAVFDRSGGLYFPSREISSKTLNSIEFKKICCDKFETYKLLGDKFMAKSFFIKNKTDLKNTLRKMDPNKKYALKPTNGLGGEGIIIEKPAVLIKTKLKKNRDYIIQEFIDTSKGIVGLTKGLHDLRVVIVNNKIIWSHIRTPKDGSFLANVAQGGSIKEIKPSLIPKEILKNVSLIKKIIQKNYGNVFYSIDFGVENGRSFVFELNDQIGFPTENMKCRKFFFTEIYKALALLSKKVL